MRIKKTSQYIEGGANLSNVYGNSNENGYTQDFLNNALLSQFKCVAKTSTGSGYSFSFTDDDAKNKCYLIVASKQYQDGAFGGMWFIRTGGTKTATICYTSSNQIDLTSTIDNDTITCTFSSAGNYSKIVVYQLMVW